MSKWATKADPSVGWNGITKATPLKEFPPEEPNRTDPVDVITKLQNNDEVHDLIDLTTLISSIIYFLEIRIH